MCLYHGHAVRMMGVLNFARSIALVNFVFPIIFAGLMWFPADLENYIVAECIGIKYESLEAKKQVSLMINVLHTMICNAWFFNKRRLKHFALRLV